MALLLMDHGAVVTPRLLSAAPAVMALTGWLSEDRARLARENSRLQQGIPQWAAAAASHIFGGAADSAEAAGDNGPRAASTQLGADSPPPANPRLRSIRRRTNSSAAINTG